MTAWLVFPLFTDKVEIIAEDTVTKVEKILLNNSQVELAHNFRTTILQIFTTQFKQTIGNILQVEVIDIVSYSSLNSAYLGVLVFLKNAPETRLAKAQYCHKNRNLSDKNNKSKISIQTDGVGECK